MKIPQSKVIEIREKADIVEIIGTYVNLQKKGNNYVANCPFHSENTPSFTVSATKKIYHCFGCDEGGDVFTFLIKYKNYTFYESLIYLADICGVDISEYKNVLNQNTSKDYSKYKNYYDIMKFVCDFYHNLVKMNVYPEAISYLKKRNFLDDDIKKFNIGYAPNFNVLETLFNKNNIDIKYALELGLLYENIKTNSYYDAFQKRLIFPIKNYFGNIVAISGRILPNFSNDKTSKYFHSPENIIFKKSKTLYNGDKIRNSIKKQKCAFICEGIVDVIALSKIGIKNAVATLGTSLSIEHIVFLNKNVKKVIIFFDNDEAGKKAVLKCLEMAIKKNIILNAVLWDDTKCKDIDEYLQKFGKDKLINLVKNNTFNIFDYYIYHLKDKYFLENIEEKKQYIYDILSLLSIYKDPITLEFYLDKLSSITKVSKSSIISLSAKRKIGLFYKDNIQNLNKEIIFEKTHKEEKTHIYQLIVLSYLINDRKYIDIYKENWPLSHDPVYRSLVNKIIHFYENNKKNLLDISLISYNLTLEEKKLLFKANFTNTYDDTLYFQKILNLLDILSNKKFIKANILKTNDKNKIQEYKRLYTELLIKEKTIYEQ